jgi:hypothetical protein
VTKKVVGVFVRFRAPLHWHQTLQFLPGQVVYGRDMIHDKQHETDWLALHKLKCAQVQDNKRENKVRVSHQYEPEQQKFTNYTRPSKFCKAGTTDNGSLPYYCGSKRYILIDKVFTSETTINIRRLTLLFER